MHELALADSIVQAVLTELDRNEWRSVDVIGIRLGALSDVVPESLEFGFEALTRESALSETRLSIERIEAHGVCRACKSEFPVPDFVFTCPRCMSHDVDLTHGMELDIAYLEVEQKTTEPPT